uniref:Uncharacterized protein n=1 Tax=Ascaris lumbricoides TaxID=6252 RepID=A0A0M3IAI5_ASCLU
MNEKKRAKYLIFFLIEIVSNLLSYCAFSRQNSNHYVSCY